MIKNLIIIAALSLPALSREPQYLARWGGDLVQWTEPSTGHRWTCSYEDFFRYCGGRHPNALGIRVLGKLPASFIAREKAAKARQNAPVVATTRTSSEPVKAAPAPRKRATPPPEPPRQIEESLPLPDFKGDELVADLPPMANLLFPDPPTVHHSVITGLPLETLEPEQARTTELVPVEINGSYDVRHRGIVTASRLDDIFEGELAGHGQDFIDAARNAGICPIFLAGVAMHESDNGKSRIVREKLNAFGLFKDGKYITFSDVKESIVYAANMLGGKGYVTRPKSPLTTISAIHARYCPIGDNDPKNLNKHWTNGVVYHMKKVHGPTLYVASL